MSCAAVVEALNEDEELPYGGWSDGKGITTRELGRKLQPYKIKAKSVRIADSVPNGYEREQFEDAWSRYLPENGISTATTATTVYPSQISHDFVPLQKGVVAVSPDGAKPHEQRDVAVVAVSSAEVRIEDAERPTCPNHNGARHWRSKTGTIRCVECLPPVFETAVVEWLEP